MAKHVRADGTMRICLIKPGWGSSGFYPAEVLRRDGPKVFRAGTQGFANHQTAAEASARPEGDVRDLWSVLKTDAEYQEHGPKGPGLYADAQVLPAFAPYAEALAPYIGCSIRALGRAKPGEAEGRKGPIVEALVAARSVDWVTLPGAGGGAVELFEAARAGAPAGGLETLVERSSPVAEHDPQDTHLLSEAEAVALREAMAGMERRLQEAEQRAATAAQELHLRESVSALHEALAPYQLNKASYGRLVDDLTPRLPVAEDGKVDKRQLETIVKEAVVAHLEWLAEATGIRPGQICGMGAGRMEQDALREAQEMQEREFARLLGADRAKIAAAGR